MEELSSVDEASELVSSNTYRDNGDDIRKHEVKLLLGLEAELEGHDERVVHGREHGALREDVRDLARARRDVRLADRLERVYALRVLLADIRP